MAIRKETLEQERERVYREEQKNNPAGNFNDNLNRTQSCMPNTTGMSTKEIGGLIVVSLLIFILFRRPTIINNKIYNFKL
jgi:hypothetical protein